MTLEKLPEGWAVKRHWIDHELYAKATREGEKTRWYKAHSVELVWAFDWKRLSKLDVAMLHLKGKIPK